MKWWKLFSGASCDTESVHLPLCCDIMQFIYIDICLNEIKQLGELMSSTLALICPVLNSKYHSAIEKKKSISLATASGATPQEKKEQEKKKKKWEAGPLKELIVGSQKCVCEWDKVCVHVWVSVSGPSTPLPPPLAKRAGQQRRD